MRSVARRVLAVFGVAPVVVLAGSQAHYTEYPSFKYAEAHPMLVVARVSRGADLPEFEECKQPNVICLHSPQWFHARPLLTVYGEEAIAPIEIATPSHYGQDRYDSDQPWLINVFVKDGAVVMPINQFEGLVRRADGELFLPLRYPDEPMFLPCSVKQIWEELAPGRYSPRLRSIPEEDFEWSGVRKHPEMFVVTKGGAVVKYGIRMSRLKAFLAGTQLATTDYRCGEGGQ